MGDVAARRILGVDIGNTSCTVAVMRQGTLQTIANEQGNRSTPCCVAMTEAVSYTHLTLPTICSV